MASSRKQLDEGLRQEYLETVKNFLSESGEEVLRVKSNEICLPVLDGEQNDKWLVVTFKVPTDDSYDGYIEQQSYEMKLADKKAKAEERDRKAALDKEKKAKAKAEKEAAKQAVLDAAQKTKQ